MASLEKVRAGDVGTKIHKTIKEDGSAVDISGADVMELILALNLGEPGEIRVVVTGAFTTVADGGTADGTDGKVTFTTTGDATWTKKGSWKEQAQIKSTTTPDGCWATEIQTREVEARL